LELPHHLVTLLWLISKIVTPTESVKLKEKYHLINWSAYNAGLKQRGSLTLWLWEGIAQQWYYQGKQAGQYH